MDACFTYGEELQKKTTYNDRPVVGSPYTMKAILGAVYCTYFV